MFGHVVVISPRGLRFIGDLELTNGLGIFVAHDGAVQVPALHFSYHVVISLPRAAISVNEYDVAGFGDLSIVISAAATAPTGQASRFFSRQVQ